MQSQKLLFSLTVGLGAVCALSSSSQASIAETTANDGFIHLIYDAATGNLTVNPNGGVYGTVTLASSPAVFKVGTLGTSPEYFEGDTGTDLSFGVLAGTQSQTVTLPSVLQPNLNESTLLNAITVVADTQGPPISNFSFTGGITTPEPASLAVLGLGGLALMSRRRVTA